MTENTLKNTLQDCGQKNISHTFGALASLLFAAGVSFGTLASAKAVDVVLDSSEIELPASNVRLIRIASTPDKIRLRVPVSMGRTECLAYRMETQSGYNSSRCGYTTVVRQRCAHQSGNCYPGRRGYPHCGPVGRNCYNEVVSVPRFCTWEYPVCSSYGIRSTDETKKLTLKFKNMPELGAEEMEVYELRSKQKRVDGREATFDLEAVETNGLVKINEQDGIATGFKDRVIVKGRSE